MTRPRTVDMYEVFCGVLYLLTTGCQWRNLSSDFPNWKTAYSYYQIWRKVDKFLHCRCTKREKHMDS
ncbi:hypothetical protein COC69_17205 [Bacillus cereus]|uniref:Insertion element IS402-like domain-containing protein n=1 Tax=Bacillus cereus TaxID=1396 RepID=A0A9X7GV86_BACCE|nr:hypothetical protein COC69_17205 [Bacillus cereus]